MTTTTETPKARTGKLRKLSPAETAETFGSGPATPTSRPARDWGNDLFGSIGVPIDHVQPSALNPRKRFDEDDLQQLAASLNADGLLEPIVVRPVEQYPLDVSTDEMRFEIVAGERRWRAAKLAGFRRIQTTIRAEVEDQTLVRLALLENLARTDLSPLEEAEGYRRLQELGMKQTAIAAAVHRSQPSIANAIRLLKLPETVRTLVGDGRLSASHALALVRFADFPDAVSMMATLAVEREARAHDLEKGVPYAADLQGGHHYDHHAGKYVDSPQIIQLLGYSEEWAECRSCPFGAYFAEKNNNWGRYCFKPEHYAELKAAHQRAEALAEAERIEKMRPQLVDIARRNVAAELKAEGCTASPGVVEEEAEAAVPDDAPLDDLLKRVPMYSYETMRDLSYEAAPQGCTKACPCRSQALYNGRVITVCTDKKRLAKLQRDTTTSKKKGSREEAKAYTTRALAAVDAIAEVGTREQVLLAFGLLGPTANEYHAVRNWEAACKRQGLPEAADQYRNLQWFMAREPRQVARLVIETLLRGEIAQMVDDNYGFGARSPEKHPAHFPVLTYVLNVQPPAVHTEPVQLKPEDRPMPAGDELLGEEIAAEQLAGVGGSA